MLINESVDIKLFYRFIEFTSRLLNVDVTHERFKNIIFDQFKAETKAERDVKKFANAYLFAINNQNQLLSSEFIQTVYFILTNEILDDVLVESIKMEYYLNREEPSHHLAAKLHLCIYKTDIKRKIEFGFIISNIIMLIKNRNPLIPYQFVYSSYLDTVKEGNVDRLMAIFAQIESRSIHKKYEHNISREEIIDAIKRLAYKIISSCQIDKLYLYGSYAKDNVNPSSDIDLLVQFKSNLLLRERDNNTKTLKKIIEGELQRTVDVLDFGHALNNLDLIEMEKTIKLI